MKLNLNVICGVIFFVLSVIGFFVFTYQGTEYLVTIGIGCAILSMQMLTHYRLDEIEERLEE